jgi:hypothetical protein
MALRRTSRSVSRVVGRLMARTYFPPMSNRQPVGNYLIEHKGSHVHRPSEPCELCAALRRNGEPINDDKDSRGGSIGVRP